MKIKLFAFSALLLILGSCTAPRYVPHTDDIGVARYGSQIILNTNDGEKITGEFIAIDKATFIILTDYDYGRVVSIARNEVKKFKLRYAQPKKYGWTVPVFILSTISHGGFLLFTAPINAAITGSATRRGAKDFTYNNKTISDDEIQMFARFPQGIPEGVELVDIARGRFME